MLQQRSQNPHNNGSISISGGVGNGKSKSSITFWYPTVLEIAEPITSVTLSHSLSINKVWAD